MEELKLAFYMSIDLFLASAAFVYPLKHKKPRKFPDVFKEYIEGTLT